MAGSRFEAVGSIFTRINGLMKSGALKYAERPLWYDVYAAFPPKTEPRIDRKHEVCEVKDILYIEDMARSKFYTEYGNPDNLDLIDNNSSNVIQRFINKYMEFSPDDRYSEEAFDKAVDSLRSEGVELKNVREEEELIFSAELCLVFENKNDNLLSMKIKNKLYKAMDSISEISNVFDHCCQEDKAQKMKEKNLDIKTFEKLWFMKEDATTDEYEEELYKYRGDYAYYNQSFSEAVDWYTKAIEVMKNKDCRAYREAQDCLARCYHATKQYEECRNIILLLLKGCGNYDQTSYIVSLLLETAVNENEKILFHKYLIWLHPGNQTLWKSLNRSLNGLESFDKKDRLVNCEADAKNVRNWILSESPDFEKHFEEIFGVL
ncbi:DgyrCDS316 [Dimorphilus gyrociliatus]|uniref:Small ribosomal subunit protein mS23 n=1 Tax=Dimorphilus gyrociliatus TaxID=2664684 RepID=A0A7I8V462_9ANNE|nr:DgyrCDS316 [Dimorphilus gyrociliatus]